MHRLRQPTIFVDQLRQLVCPGLSGLVGALPGVFGFGLDRRSVFCPQGDNSVFSAFDKLTRLGQLCTETTTVGFIRKSHFWPLCLQFGEARTGRGGFVFGLG